MLLIFLPNLGMGGGRAPVDLLRRAETVIGERPTISLVGEKQSQMLTGEKQTTIITGEF